MKKKIVNGPKSPAVMNTYETEIEYDCPVRGKVKQKVKVQRYQSVEPDPFEEVLPSKSVTEKLDAKHSGLLLSDDSLEEEKES